MLWDEYAYVRGFADVAAGRTPYEPVYMPFLYPPPFAYAGAWLLRHGTGATLATLRAANLAGLVALAWCAAAWLPLSWRWRVTALAGVLVISPVVAQIVHGGNLSATATGMIVTALALWRRHPAVAGLLLGLSLLIKPLAPAPLVALAGHRPSGGGRRHLVAAGLALGLAGGIFLVVPRLEEFVARSATLGFADRTLSPHRLLAIAGVPVEPLWVTAPALVATLVLARRKRIDERPLTALGLAACVAATPLVWSHTLIVTLPLQAMAAAAAAIRFRDAPAAARRARGWEVALVALAVITLHVSEPATNISPHGAIFQLACALPPLLAPGALAVYVWRVA